MTTPENTLRLGIPSPGPSFRGALKSRDFTLLFIGQVGSEIGNGAVQLALPWLVLEQTGSAFQLGLSYFFQFLPMLLFGMIGGVAVDRWDRRLTIVVVDSIRAVAFLSVAGIYYAGHLTVGYIYTVIFIEASLANFFNPARVAILPSLVPEESLRPANSLMEVSRHIGFLVAPPAGGVVSAVLGPASIMLFDGVTFALSATMVYFIRWRQATREITPSEGMRHSIEMVIEQMRAGVKTIMRVKLLQVALLLGFSLNLIVAPIQVLVPLFVSETKHQQADYFAFLVAGLLVGLIVGSLSSPAVARRVGLGRLAIGAVFILGIVIAIATWPPGLYPAVVAMAIAGTAIGSLNVAQTTMLQTNTTDDELGRVSATYYTFSLGVRPFGFLAMGLLASAVDIRWLFVVMGIFSVMVGFGLLRVREAREYH